MNILIGHLIVSFLSVAIDILNDKAVDSYIKRMGYVYKEEKTSFSEKVINSLDKLFYWFINCFIPFKNIKYMYMNIAEYDRIREQIFKSEKKAGNLILLEEQKKLEDSNELKLSNKDDLLLKVIAFKKVKKQNSSNNKPLAFQELSVDERIQILYRELELLYEEKARLEGIDLDKEIEMLTNPNSKEVLRLINMERRKGI